MIQDQRLEGIREEVDAEELKLRLQKSLSKGKRVFGLLEEFEEGESKRPGLLDPGLEFWRKLQSENDMTIVLLRGRFTGGYGPVDDISLQTAIFMEGEQDFQGLIREIDYQVLDVLRFGNWHNFEFNKADIVAASEEHSLYLPGHGINGYQSFSTSSMCTIPEHSGVENLCSDQFFDDTLTVGAVLDEVRKLKGSDTVS